MKSVGIFVNPNYKNSTEINNLIQFLHTKKLIKFYGLQNQLSILPTFIHEYSESIDLECILVFGGDGTILRSVDFSLKADAPLLGINLGRLGFLTDINLSEMEKSIDDFLNNKFSIQKRMLLQVIHKRKNRILFQGLALNDIVIYKGIDPKLIRVKYHCNKRFILDTYCDGVIVASPTGSTAYSLSAGGPILSPVMDAIVVTPLNPHVLSVRSLVFSSNDIISLVVEHSNCESILQLDGINANDVKIGDTLSITAAKQKVSFIKLSNKYFYQVLRKKLHMGRK